MTQSFTKKCLCLFFFVCIYISVFSQTGTESQDWRLSFGYESYSFAGSWVPLFLTLKDPLPGGRLEIVRGGEQKPSSIESYELTHSGQYEFPIFIDEKVPSFNVKIYSSGMLLAEQTFHPTDRLFSGHAILVSAVPAIIRLSLSRMLYPEEPVLVLPVLPQGLPVSALSYDGITSLVLSDPGPVLSPPQISAMGEWLALGGSVVLLDPLKGHSSMLEQLNSYFPLTGTDSERHAGLGTVHLVYTETVDRKALASGNFWKDKLHIVSFRKTHRLRPGLIFGKRFDVFQDGTEQNPMNKFIAYIVVCWIALLAGCGFFLKKKCLPAGMAVICLLSVFIFFQKNSISEVWTRGISIHMRELLLPQNGGTLASLNLYTQDPSDTSVLIRKVSPYASGFSYISFDSKDKGIMRFSPDPFLEWFHTGAEPGLVFDSSDSRTLRLTGFLPALPDGRIKEEVLAKLRQENGIAVWQIPADGGTWKESQNPPPEIAQDVDWILHVSDAMPDLEWFMGIEDVSGNTLGGMKWMGIKTVWLMPGKRQALP